MTPDSAERKVNNADIYRITLIRHGKTAGNLAHRYIGRTDEPLCPEGRKELADKSIFPEPDFLVVSPMKRCLETAEILFPHFPFCVADDLREYDFGNFEGKNHKDLLDDSDYIKWLEKGGSMDIPAGEGLENFRIRCRNAFTEILRHAEEASYESEAERKAGLTGPGNLTFVVHGGTIMSVMSAFDEEALGYYDYQIGNGEAFIRYWDGSFPIYLKKTLTEVEKWQEKF